MQRVKLEELNYKNRRQVRQAAEIYAAAFSGPPWHEKWPLEEALKEVNSWKKLKAKFKGKIFVAKTRDDKIVGLAVGHLHDPTEHTENLNKKIGRGRHYYLREIATHPEFLRRGIATALTNARLNHARKLRAISVFGRTRVDNTPKLEQFEKEGFEDFHREKHVTGGVESERVYYKKLLT